MRSFLVVASHGLPGVSARKSISGLTMFSTRVQSLASRAWTKRSPTATSGDLMDDYLSLSRMTGPKPDAPHRIPCTAQRRRTASGLRPISRTSAGRFAHGDQSVPHREQRGRAPAADAELGVDVLHVGADRLGRDAQVLRDLLLAHPA